MQRHYLLFTFILFLLPFSLTFSQWSTDPDSALLIGVGDYTHIISDNKGGAFVLFDGDDWVRLQKVDKYGYVQWTNITPQGGIAIGGDPSPNCGQGIACDFPLVLDDEGGVYVAFHDFCYMTPEITAAAARVQHVDSLGNLLWGTEGMVVSTHTVYESFWGGITGDGAGGIIALYNERDSLYGPTKLYGQHFDGQGNRLWGNDGILLKESGGFSYMVSDGYGGAVFTYGFYIQRLNSQGQKLYGESGIEIPTGGLEIKVDYDNEHLYVYGGNYIGSSRNRLAVQKLSLSDGALLWDSLGVTIDTLSVDDRVGGFDIIPGNGIAISWHEEVMAGNWDVFVQWISPEGNLFYSPGGIPSSVYPSSKHSSLLISSSENENSIICIWEDLRNPFGFYAQRINSSGERLWGEDDAVITTRPAVPTDNDITFDMQGGAIISWFEQPSFYVCVQQISKNGHLGEVITAIKGNNQNNISNDYKLCQNYPNPFNSLTVIRFRIPEANKVDLKIVNNLGQQIKDLLSAKLLPGWYEFKWDGMDEYHQQVSSGIYYYRLQVGNHTQTRKMLLLR
jgi:hypothetical protein